MHSKVEVHRRRRVIQSLASFPLWTLSVPSKAQSVDVDEASAISLISNFSKLRGIAYNDVRDLKAMHKLSKSRLTRSQELYGKARTAADTWIDTVRLSLAANGRLDSSAVASQTKELQSRVGALVDYAQVSRAAFSPGEKHKNPVVLAAIAALLVPLVDAAVKVYEAWSRKDEKQRNEIRVELDRVRWATFQEIL